MAVLLIYSNHNHKITEKVLTPENTHTKGNVNIYNAESGKKLNNKSFGKFSK